MAELTEISGKVRQYMKEHEEEFLGQFRHLHQHPELSFQEHETTAYIKKKLEGWGIEILDIGLETGVVGLLKGGKEGPCIALRADIDALPVLEESTSEYPSQNKGVMHACGHDTHMASLLGAAQILAEFRDELEWKCQIPVPACRRDQSWRQEDDGAELSGKSKGGCNLWYAQFTGDPGRNCGSQKWTTDGGRGSYYFHH